MREIKFRAWDLMRMTTSGIMFNSTTSMLEIPNGSGMVLMQYTGLKDKNGKEIYEGDIITNEIDDQGTKRFNPKTGFYDYDTKKEIVVVRYNEYWGHFIFSNQSIRGKIEIIGNIYENPELLEAK